MTVTREMIETLLAEASNCSLVGVSPGRARMNAFITKVRRLCTTILDAMKDRPEGPEGAGPTGKFPFGRPLRPGDQGGVKVAVSADAVNGVVVLTFGMLTRWLAIRKSSVPKLIAALQEFAATLPDEPTPPTETSHVSN